MIWRIWIVLWLHTEAGMLLVSGTIFGKWDIEEVPCVELEARLVCMDFHHSTTARFLHSVTFIV